MNIHALTVCVNYADYLAVGLQRLATHLASWMIVTDMRDAETLALANRHSLRVHMTDAFCQDGATFNKGRAMEEARQKMPWSDWILFVDADVVPEPDWYRKVCNYKPTIGHLYGAARYDAQTADRVGSPDCKVIPGDGVGVGYWQLFHSADPRVQQRPLLETCWRHGGVYDSHFLRRWPTTMRHNLPIRLDHLGERDNWWGRGNKEAFAAMMEERRRRGGYDHERIGP